MEQKDVPFQVWNISKAANLSSNKRLIASAKDDVIQTFKR